MRKNSVKNARINEAVREELSSIIRNLKDPRIAPMTSVTSAIVATDLKTCKVSVSVLGTEEEKAETMKGLESSRGFIRHELARILNLRNTPELSFTLDESIAYGVRMSKLIDDVISRDEEAEAGREKEEG